MLTVVLVVALVVVMVLCVVATMVVENWSRLVVRLPSHTDPPGVPGADPAAGGPAVGDPAAREPSVDHLHLPDRRLELAGRAAADRLVAVLFAAYAAAREPEANRVAAWVTASDWPPSVVGPSYRPGADLRGRPAAVERLLRCADRGRCWVTLNTDVDIERGLRMRPPTCELLESLLVVLHATRAAMSRLDAEQIRRLRAAVDRLEPTWGPSTGAPDVVELSRALEHAAGLGAGLAVVVPLQPLGAADGVDEAVSAPPDATGADPERASTRTVPG